MATRANALHTNFDIDYVITYRFHETSGCQSVNLKFLLTAWLLQVKPKLQ